MLLDFLNNHLLRVAVIAFFTAQTAKFLLSWAVEKKPRLSRLVGDGGMPSGHSATVTALSAAIGYTVGFGTPLFALSLIFAIVVMHDAKGVRRETGKQAISILLLFDTINKLLKAKDKIEQEEELKTLVGHSPLQVFFGAVLGVIVVVLYILIFALEPYCYAGALTHF